MKRPEELDKALEFCGDPEEPVALAYVAQLEQALQQIADIAGGSTTANSLPHIADIARRAIT